MASREVTFKITPDGKAGIQHLDDYLKRLDRISAHPAFKKVSDHLTRQQRSWVQVRNHMRDATRDYNRLAAAATRWKQATDGIGKTNVKIVQQTQRVAQATRTADNAAKGMARTWNLIRKTVVDAAGTLGKMSARGILQGSASLRGGATSIAGSVQGVGISTRMSGIAFGQQLGQVMAGPLSGNIMSGVIQGLRGLLNISAGITTIAIELGTRVATGIAGGIVKAGGLLAGGLMQAITSALAGFASLTSGPLGLIINSLGGALNNVVSSASTIAGEMVGQIGNVLTGLGEMFRGAFQAAVNIGAGVLNGLVTAAQGVVQKVGGVLGTLGKAVLGTAGTIGGFALRDIFKAEGALTRGFVILDPSVTGDQRNALREWAFNIRRELGNITADDPGKAVERAISTGFQKDPEGAMRFASAALRTVSLVGDEDAGVVTRAAAKVWMAFKDELIKQAGSSEAGMDLLFDKLFAVKNFGDLDLGDLAVRIGDVEGPAKSLGLTLDEMLSTISKLSLILGKEQTFTAFGQLMTTFTKMGPGAFEELSRQKIQVRELGPDDQKKLAALSAEREALLGQDAAYKSLGNRLRDLRLKKKELKAAGRDTTSVEKEILKTEQKRAALAKKSDKPRIKALDEEIERIETMGGKLRNVLAIWNDILAKLKDGSLNEAKLSKIIPNIRALRGMLGLDALQKVAPTEGQAVEDGIKNAAGTVAAGQEVRAEDFGTKMLKVLAEIKQPFVQFWLTNREAVNAFVDDMTGRLRGFNEWWKQALEAPGAAAFADNLGGKLRDLFSFLPEGGAVEVDAFWAAMNNGLNTAWDFGSKVAGVIGSIAEGVDRGAQALGGWGSIWEAIKTGASAVAEEVEKMSSGDFSTWIELWERAKESADELWFTIKMKGAEAFAHVLDKVDEFGQKTMDWIERIGQKLTAVLGGMAAFNMMGNFPMGMAAAGGAARGAAGGMNPATAAMAASALGGGAKGIPAWMKRMSPANKLALLGNVPRAQRAGLAKQLGIAIPGARAQGAVRSGAAFSVPGPSARGGALARLAGLGGGATKAGGKMNPMLSFLGKGVKGAGRFAGGAARFLGPLAAAMTVFEAIDTFGGPAKTEPKSIGDSLGTIGGAAATGFALGGPIGGLIGGLAGVGMDQFDRHKRSNAVQQAAVRQVNRRNTLAPLASGQGYYDPASGHFTNFKQHTGPNKDILDEGGGAIAAYQMTALDPEAAPQAREAAQKAINWIYDEMIAAMEKRAATATETESKAAAASIIDPVRAEVEGLAAQFPEDATLAGLRDQVKRLADEMAKTGAGRDGVAHKARGLASQARQAADEATRKKASAAYSPGQPYGGALPNATIGANGQVQIPPEQLAALPANLREQIQRHQAGGTLSQDVYDGIMAGQYSNAFSGGTNTTAAPHPDQKKGGGAGGTPHGAPGGGSKTTGGGLSDKWYYDQQGFLHYRSMMNGEKLFDHAFSRSARNDPFHQGPMRAGQFGFARGGLGKDLKKAGSGGFGIISGRSIKESGGSGFAGFGPAPVERPGASNQNAFAEKLKQAAAKLEESAKNADSPEAAMKLKEAAVAMKQKAAEVAKSQTTAIKAIKDAVTGQTKTSMEVVKTAKDLAQATTDNVESLKTQIEELKAEIEELKAQAVEGNG